MKMRTTYLGVGLTTSLLGVAFVPSIAIAAAKASTCMTRSSASVAALVRGDYKSAAKDFAPQMAKQFPPAKIAQAWEAVQASAGAYQSRGATEKRDIRGQSMVVTPVTFAHAEWDFVYGCDDQNRIAAAQLMPVQQLDAAIEASRGEAGSKAPVKAAIEANGVHVEPLSISSPFGPLRGALTLPAGSGPFPAVVLVGGSGPNDLDEAVGASKPFRDIANGLAAAGIASLRYDKRQTDYGLKMSANAHLTVDEEETDDALTAAHLLAKQNGIDPHRVFVLGHSEGGMLAPRMGQRDPELAGVIMLAAPARKLLTVIREQVREQGERAGLPKANIEAQEKSLADEQTLLDKADPKHPPTGSFGGAPQTWWFSLHEYDQVTTAKSLSMPILILQGGSDFQVSPKLDFDTWKQALAGKANVTFHSFPGLGHLFTPAGKTGTVADYAKPAHVDPKVIAVIANWIKAQPAK
ncbi:MAG TPA: alpha/beta fold hydrolase [Rhodanobacteraceae bacterium]